MLDFRGGKHDKLQEVNKQKLISDQQRERDVSSQIAWISIEASSGLFIVTDERQTDGSL